MLQKDSEGRAWRTYQVVFLAHDESVTEVLLFYAFHLHPHVVAGFRNFNLLDDKNQNSKTV
jgi:hypothetical protein